MNSSGSGASLDSESLEKEFLRLTSEFPEFAHEILQKEAEFYNKELIKNIPYDPFSLTGTHLKDSTIIKQSKKALDLAPRTNVGFTNDPEEHGWQAHFTNYGTIHQKGQYWLERVNSNTVGDLEDIAISGLEDWLKNGRN